MKSFVVVGIAVAMLGIGMPAMAADEESATFVALSKMITETTSLQPMTDDQLSSVEGTFFDVCLGCANVALFDQENNAAQVNLGGFFQANAARQSNFAAARQEIN